MGKLVDPSDLESDVETHMRVRISLFPLELTKTGRPRLWPRPCVSLSRPRRILDHGTLNKDP